ncbi:MAG: PilZ domain-containing protein [Pseudomonadales bacterium]
MSDNVVQLESARTRQQRASDLRLHPRLQSEDRLFTQVVLSADDPDLVGTTLSCSAVNLSVGGVQFRTNAQVPASSLLDLWIDVATRPGKFFLAGEVRWCRPVVAEDGSPEWLVGVQLKSGAATDILDWRDYHASAYAR